MKTIILSVVTITCALFASVVLADKITVRGTPVVVEKQGDVYVAPSSAVATPDGYYYFTVDSKNQVCYKEVQPGLTKVNVGTMSVRLGSDTVTLNCYSTDPEYFVVE